MIKQKFTYPGSRRSAPVFSLTLLIAAAVLAGCASVKIEKTYTDGGALKEITVLAKGQVREKFEFLYDDKARLTALNKLPPLKKTPVLSKRFFYDTLGRIRIQNHTEEISGGGSSVKDVWVESFFYDNTGRLYRTETSFKSAYSIARIKAPLLITRYYYENSHVSHTIVNAGIFRNEVNYSYAGSRLKTLEFRHFSLGKDRVPMQLRQTVRFEIKDLSPVGAEEDKDGKSIGLTKDEYMPIFTGANLHAVLLRPVYAKDQGRLLDYLLETLIAE